jgi:GNAT superfamily N-acetyltransferase
MIERTCPMCGAPVAGESIESFGDVWMVHLADAHADLPFPEVAKRNYGEGLARMTGSAERLDAIGAVEIHAVDAARVDDWLQLFDHDLFAGKPEWSACYCVEPHEADPAGDGNVMRPWRDKRQSMIERFAAGTTFGYLAYVDGRPAGWVNASSRCDYALFRRDDDADASTVGVSCFAIAPPYRGHGIAKQLLERVVADAAARGATAVEAYPFNDGVADGPSFRGDPAMFAERGFTEVKVRARDTVVRRPAGD